MSEQTDNLISLLKPFGLSAEEAQIYLVMLECGKLSALEISRKLSMGRTKVYRILDKLIAYELVVNEYDEVGFKFVASPPEKLSFLIARQESEISVLKQSLPQVQERLSQLVSGVQSGSKVLYYKGVKGLTQVNFNLLQAKGEICSYEVSYAEAYMDHEDAEEMRRELVKAKIFIQSISNMTKMEPFTKVSEIVKNWWEIRHIDPTIFTIKADVFIYNDVFVMCHYLNGGDVFCVETVNQELATMQKQLFEVMWNQAQPMTKLDDFGAVKLVSPH